MNQQQLLDVESKCKEMGDAIRLDWENRNSFDRTLSSAPEYGYSPSLHTCLWSGNYVRTSFILQGAPGNAAILRATRTEFVMDVSTKTVLVEYEQRDGQQLGAISEADFKRRKSELFSSN